MRRTEKLLASALVIGALGSVASFGVFGLFSATTQNAGNEVATGTVSFTDNDSGSALYSVTGAKPGDSQTRCIKATYTGSLAAGVRLYSPSSPGPLAQHIDLTITQGTQPTSTFPSCTGFTPDATGQIYSGTLQSFEQTHSGYAGGLSTKPATQSHWNPGNAVVYRVQATVRSDTPNSAQGTTSGVHSFIWEARNE